MEKERGLIWFTRDLRIHDNEVLLKASQSGLKLCALAFVPQNRSKASKSFYVESLFDLKVNLQQLGMTLFIVEGSPEIEIPKWVVKNSIDQIWVQASFNFRDQRVIETVSTKIGSDKLSTVTQGTLIHSEDLPFSLDQMPLVFSQYRKIIKDKIAVRTPGPMPSRILNAFLPSVPEDSKVVEDVGCPNSYVFDLKPGEASALRRIEDYIWKSGCFPRYVETRNGMLELNESSKFSIYLGTGSISVRNIYAELIKYENAYGLNDSLVWFIQELFWRDYFKFLSLKLRDKLFSINGIKDSKISFSDDQKLFEKWKEGKTGQDFVDANMREFQETSWMSNRGRQNVASYLAKSLKVNWTWGAHYFEENLVDSDPELNWGNWLYLAGVGTDPRDRIFNVERQADLYDPQGLYRRKWQAGV